MSSFCRGLCALAAVLPLTLPASAAEWVSLRGSYAVSIAGIPIGRFNLDGQLSGRSYRLDGTGGMTGLGRLVSSGEGSAKSHGRLVAGRVLPAHYAYSEVAGPRTVSIRMDMSGGGVRQLSVAPPVEPTPERVPVTEAHKRGIVDPMSGLLVHVKGSGSLLSPTACAHTVPIFDGRSRFDIELSYAGSREVRTPRGYAGPVLVCRAAYRPIAGHRPAKKEVQQMRSNPTIEVWLAPVEGTRILAPYRISIRTTLGDAVAEADHFQVGPATRQAAAQ